MKYICLGYHNDDAWTGKSAEQQKQFMEDCFAYDALLRKNGHFTGGEALQGPQTAATIRPSAGGPVVTDGPYAETKEQLGGIMILEARDLNHAIQLMSHHPSSRMGSTWEIRPANEQVNAMFQEEEKYSMSSQKKE